LSSATFPRPQKRSAFYNTDYVDPDFELEREDEEDAREEEEEALRLQAKQVAELDEDDYGLPFGGLPSASKDKKDKKKKTVKKTENELVADLDIELDAIGIGGNVAIESIKRDLSGMPAQERLEQLAEQAPELLDLCEEYSSKLEEYHTVLKPLAERVSNTGDRMTGDGKAYFRLRERLVLSYLLNVGYYLYLRSLGQWHIHRMPPDLLPFLRLNSSFVHKCLSECLTAPLNTTASR
jgi:U3 small nucleolar RNA-associated protein 3